MHLNSFNCNSVKRVAAISAIALYVAGCSSSDTPDDTSCVVDNTSAFAFASGTTPKFDAGQVERITIGDSIQRSCGTPSTLSNIVTRAYGDSVYQIGRAGIDSITKFNKNNLAKPVYQYSVLNGASSTPSTADIVFANETQAFVLQALSTSILIVNPSATSEAEFITGSIDISAYDTDAPDAVNGVVVNRKLFVLMQRLEGFQPTQTAYVAVFDLDDNNAEVNTEKGENGLNGIALTTLNPESLQYIESTSEVLVMGRGNPFVNLNNLQGDPYQGGIESIDVNNYTLDMLLDDGTESANQGFFTYGKVASATRGYIATSRDIEVMTADGAGIESKQTLRSYNPMTGVLADGVVAGLEDTDISVLGVDLSGRLWVGIGGQNPGFTIIDPADNSIVEQKVATRLVPNQVVFIGAGS